MVSHHYIRGLQPFAIAGRITFIRVSLRCFRDPIRVPRIENRVPRIKENRVPRIREIGSLQIHIGYLTLKKNLLLFV